jgi:hypothetical protein
VHSVGKDTDRYSVAKRNASEDYFLRRTGKKRIYSFLKNYKDEGAVALDD